MVLNEIDYVRRSRVDVSDLCFDATVRDAAVGFDDARGDRRERERERERVVATESSGSLGSSGAVPRREEP